MAEAGTGGTDERYVIKLWPARRTDALLIILALAMMVAPVLMITYAPTDRGYRLAVEMLRLTLYGALLLWFSLWRLLHRRDQYVIDQQGVRLEAYGRRVAIAWSELTEFWFSTSALHLVSGKRKLRLQLSKIAENLGAARLLRARLEPWWQRKLQQMAVAPTRLNRSEGHVMLTLIGVIGLLFLALGFAPRTRALFGDPMIVVMMLLVLGGMAFLAYRRVVTAGPDEVRVGTMRIRLAEVERIRVANVAGAESWTLQTARRKYPVVCWVDRPVVCDHILRRCPHAAFEFDLRMPRNQVDTVFLPMPPGAPPIARETGDSQAIQQAANRIARTQIPLMFAALAWMFAVVLSPIWFTEQREAEAYRTMAQPVVGEFYRTENCWHARYQAGGAEQTTHIYHLETAPPGLREGDPVELSYLPDQPDRARLKGELPQNSISLQALAGTWAAAVLLTVFALAIIARDKRRRQSAEPASRVG